MGKMNRESIIKAITQVPDEIIEASYSIEFCRGRVVCQMWYDSESLKKCLAWGAKLTIDDNGFPLCDMKIHNKVNDINLKAILT